MSPTNSTQGPNWYTTFRTEFYHQNVPQTAPEEHDPLTTALTTGTMEDVVQVLSAYKEQNGEEALKEYVEDRGWESKNVSKEQPYKALSQCDHIETLEQFVELLPKDKIGIALQFRGAQLLINFLEKPVEDFEKILNLCKEHTPVPSIIHLHRDYSSMSILDRACLYSKTEHVKVLLDHISKEDKKYLLFTEKTPLEHSTSIGCKQLILAEMEKFR